MKYMSITLQDLKIFRMKIIKVHAPNLQLSRYILQYNCSKISRMQMSHCMPTLHHLTNIICLHEVLNIVNITNLVPQVFVNKKLNNR